MVQQVVEGREVAMPREDRERRYIADYMMEAFPRGGYSLNVPLGPIPDDIKARYGAQAGANLYRPSRPRIDATAWDSKSYWLIEAKVREAKAAIGDLLVYRSLAERTLDMPGYIGQELRLRLVVPWALDWVVSAATSYGMHLVIYLPAWVEEYVRSRQEYFTREYRLARDEKTRLRKTLGLE